ncbi:phage baseplate assembly protein V [Fodinicurvata sp. EGI_FJ10296]|uniref:phage baseplate assembly protein V n=1 Tax=Fodinicurvata sp. EGI_FJ10296 TaxID=3231908 RepID=UPI003451D0E8
MAERPTLDRDLSEAERRIAGLVQYAVVTEASYDPPRLRVSTGPVTSNWIPFATARAGQDRTWHPPEVGEQVVVICPGGDLNQGCVVGSLYRAAHPPPADSADIHRTEYADGTVVEHDRAQGLTRIAAKGRVRVEAEGDITLRSKGAIAIRAEGPITINGATVDIN